MRCLTVSDTLGVSWALGCTIFLTSHLERFPENLGDTSKEQKKNIIRILKL